MSDEPADPSSQPIAPLPLRDRNSYPWRLCIGRFLKRLFFGAVIWIIVFIAALVSALPSGYGNQDLARFSLAASVLLPLWALHGFLPPDGEWRRRIGTGRLASYITLVMLAVGLGGVGVVTLARSGEVERQARSKDRELGIRVCTADLNQISAPVAMDSLLIESGKVDASMLRELLGDRGLEFVELRAQSGKDWRTRQATYGVAAFSGDQTDHFSVAAGVKIVRVALARKGDEACTAAEVLGLQGFIGGVPTSPDACLRVDLDEQARASHALRAVPADGYPAFIKWALVERATGTVLASLTSSDAPLSPSRQDGGAKDEKKWVGDDIVHCRSPHFSLMNLVYGRDRQQEDRLRLGKRAVALDVDAAEPDNPVSWKALAAPEESVDDWSKREDARHGPAWTGRGPAWKDAYRAAEQSGWAGYAQGVIDFKAGVISTPRLPPAPHRHAIMRGSNKGYMAAWPTGPNSVALAYFGLEGGLLWKRQIVSSMPLQDERARFGLMGMEWDEREIRLYGFRRMTVGADVDVRVLTVPMPPRGSSGEKRTSH